MANEEKILQEVIAPKGAKVMTLRWQDGQESIVHHRILRAFCPCAHCQGHQGTIRWLEPEGEDALELTDLGTVGNYALRMSWADSHTTGIYTFDFLHQLGATWEADEATLRAMVFADGKPKNEQ